MRWCTLTVVALGPPATLATKTPSSSESPDGVLLAYQRFADVFGSRLVAAFDAVP